MERTEPPDPLDALLRPPALGSRVDALVAFGRRRGWWVLAACVPIVVALVLLWPEPPGGLTVESLPVAGAASPSGPATSAPGSADASVDEAGAPNPASAVGDSAASSTVASFTVVMHVAGAVHSPGVVTVPNSARVADAVAAAGGATGDADLDRVNLAAPAVDGARVFVPPIGGAPEPVVIAPELPASGASGAAGSASTTPDAKVNLNSASVDELQTLPGVGPATADAIVAHREANGPFSSPEALDEVRGIGPAKLAALIELVTV